MFFKVSMYIILGSMVTWAIHVFYIWFQMAKYMSRTTFDMQDANVKKYKRLFIVRAFGGFGIILLLVILLGFIQQTINSL